MERYLGRKSVGGTVMADPAVIDSENTAIYPPGFGDPSSGWGIGQVSDGEGGWRDGSVSELGEVWDFGSGYEGMDASATALLQEQFEMNRSLYNPVAQELGNWFMNDGARDQNINESRQAGLGAGNTAVGMAGRDVSRYGASMTPSQRQQLQTGLAMDRTAGGVGAANNTRQTLMDTRLAGQQKLLGLGHGVASQGIGGIVGGASRDADRMASNQMMQDQADAAGASNRMAAGSAIASVAAYAWMAGFL